MLSRKYPGFGLANSSVLGFWRLRLSLAERLWGRELARDDLGDCLYRRNGVGQVGRGSRLASCLDSREILLNGTPVGDGVVELVAEAVGKDRVVGSRFPSVSLWDWEVLVGRLPITPGASGPPLEVTCAAPFLGTEALGHPAFQLGDVAKLCGSDEGALDTKGSELPGHLRTTRRI